MKKSLTEFIEIYFRPLIKFKNDFGEPWWYCRQRELYSWLSQENLSQLVNEKNLSPDNIEHVLGYFAYQFMIDVNGENESLKLSHEHNKAFKLTLIQTAAKLSQRSGIKLDTNDPEIQNELRATSLLISLLARDRNKDNRKAFIKLLEENKSKVPIKVAEDSYPPDSFKLIVLSSELTRLPYVDFSYVDFKELKNKNKIDLSHQNLNHAQFQKSHLKDLVFAYANLLSADFEGSIIEQSNFDYANLIGANLLSCVIEKATFSFASFSRTILKKANLWLEAPHLAHLYYQDFDEAFCEDVNLVIPHREEKNLKTIFKKPEVKNLILHSNPEEKKSFRLKDITDENIAIDEPSYHKKIFSPEDRKEEKLKKNIGEMIDNEHATQVYRILKDIIYRSSESFSYESRRFEWSRMAKSESFMAAILNDLQKPPTHEALPAAITIEKIEIIRNKSVYERYNAKRSKLLEKSRTSPLEDHLLERFNIISSKINEGFWFHGTSPENAGGIYQTGFDISKVKPKWFSGYGPQGRGHSFSDAFAKSATYAICSGCQQTSCQCPDSQMKESQFISGTKVILICRVLLGKIYVNSKKNRKNEESAPQGYDSCWGVAKSINPESEFRCNEFLVSNDDQIYPEFIIYYRENNPNFIPENKKDIKLSDHVELDISQKIEPLLSAYYRQNAYGSELEQIRALNKLKEFASKSNNAECRLLENKVNTKLAHFKSLNERIAKFKENMTNAVAWHCHFVTASKAWINKDDSLSDKFLSVAIQYYEDILQQHDLHHFLNREEQSKLYTEIALYYKVKKDLRHMCQHITSAWLLDSKQASKYFNHPLFMTQQEFCEEYFKNRMTGNEIPMASDIIHCFDLDCFVLRNLEIKDYQQYLELYLKLNSTSLRKMLTVIYAERVLETKQKQRYQDITLSPVLSHFKILGEKNLPKIVHSTIQHYQSMGNETESYPYINIQFEFLFPVLNFCYFLKIKRDNHFPSSNISLEKFLDEMTESVLAQTPSPEAEADYFFLRMSIKLAGKLNNWIQAKGPWLSPKQDDFSRIEKAITLFLKLACVYIESWIANKKNVNLLSNLLSDESESSIYLNTITQLLAIVDDDLCHYFYYMQTHEKNRWDYYQYLENMTNDNHVLDQIANIPSRDGWRPLHNIEENAWIDSLRCLLDAKEARKYPKNKDIPEVYIEGKNVEGYLHPDVVDQIFKNGEFKDTDAKDKPARHKVRNVRFNGFDFYFKEKPEQPFTALFILNLQKRLVGGPTPQLEFVKLTVTTKNGTKTTPVLISKTIPGERLDRMLENPQKTEDLLQNLDRAHFGLLIIFYALVCPEDNKGSNFICYKDETDGKYYLVGIDLERYLVPEFLAIPLKDLMEKWKRRLSAIQHVKDFKLMLKNIPFVFPCMDDEISSYLLDVLGLFEINDVIDSALKETCKVDEHMFRVFTKADRQELLYSDKDKPKIMRFLLRKGVLDEIDDKFVHTCELLSQKKLSYYEYLSYVRPLISGRYQRSIRKTRTIREAFQNITEYEYISINGKDSPTITGMEVTTSMLGDIPKLELLESIPFDAEHEDVDESIFQKFIDESCQPAAIAQKKYKEHQALRFKQALQKKEVIEKLLADNLSAFRKLTLEQKKIFINALNFADLEIGIQERLFNECQKIPFERLIIRGSNALTDLMLQKVLENSKNNLVSVKLIQCKQLTNKIFESLAQLSKLRLLNIDNCSTITGLKTEYQILTYPNLKRLFLINCSKLEVIQLEAPNLKYLDIHGSSSIDFEKMLLMCEKLRELNMDESRLLGKRELSYVCMYMFFFSPHLTINPGNITAGQMLFLPTIKIQDVYKFEKSGSLSIDFEMFHEKIKMQPYVWQLFHEKIQMQPYEWQLLYNTAYSKSDLDRYLSIEHKDKQAINLEIDKSSNFGNLHKLFFKHIDVFDTEVLELANVMFQIKFQECPGMNLDVLNFLIKICQFLALLDIEACHSIENFDFAYANSLKEFSLSQCNLDNLVVTSRTLENFTVTDCTKLKSVKLNTPQLTQLHFVGSTPIPKFEDLRSYFKQCKKLKVIHTEEGRVMMKNQDLIFIDGDIQRLLEAKKSYRPAKSDITIANSLHFRDLESDLPRNPFTVLNLSKWENIQSCEFEEVYKKFISNNTFLSVKYPAINKQATQFDYFTEKKADNHYNLKKDQRRKYISTYNSSYDHLIKIIVVGPSVGKSCLVVRFAEDRYYDNLIATIGVDFKIKDVEVSGKKVRLQIWDTASQERFRSVAQSYYRDAQIILVCFALDDASSLHSMRSFYKEGPGFIPRILVGTKKDNYQRQVSESEAKQVARELGAIAYFECSAKNGEGIDKIFLYAAEYILTPQSKDSSFFDEYESFIQKMNEKVTENNDLKNLFLQAITKDDTKAINYCLNKGVNLDGTDDNGNTALHLAVKKGSYMMVYRLLKKMLDQGIDYTRRNNKWETALDLALSQKESLLITLLESVFDKIGVKTLDLSASSSTFFGKQKVLHSTEMMHEIEKNRKDYEERNSKFQKGDELLLRELGLR